MIKDAIDNSTYLGGGVSTGGILMYVTEWAPLIGITISSIAGILTAIHLYKRIKISNQESIINIQEIELNNQELKRRSDD